MQANTDDHLKKIYFAGSKAFAKCRTSVFVDLASGDEAFTVPGAAFSFLFLDENKCIGIGQHYETGFLPYGDVFLTNDAWATHTQKTYNPQSEALNVTAIAKVKNGRVLMTGFGAVNTTVIELRY